DPFCWMRPPSNVALSDEAPLVERDQNANPTQLPGFPDKQGTAGVAGKTNQTPQPSVLVYLKAVCSRLLFSLYTNNWPKACKDFKVVGLITNGHESIYRKEVKQLESSCSSKQIPNTQCLNA
ncbi:hypothetical protein P4O66_012324, partial [Electrophorus voltai]